MESAVSELWKPSWDSLMARPLSPKLNSHHPDFCILHPNRSLCDARPFRVDYKAHSPTSGYSLDPVNVKGRGPFPSWVL